MSHFRNRSKPVRKYDFCGLPCAFDLMFARPSKAVAHRYAQAAARATMASRVAILSGFVICVSSMLKPRVLASAKRHSIHQRFLYAFMAEREHAVFVAMMSSSPPLMRFAETRSRFWSVFSCLRASLSMFRAGACATGFGMSKMCRPRRQEAGFL